jgi:hypothetical protein
MRTSIYLFPVQDVVSSNLTAPTIFLLAFLHFLVFSTPLETMHLPTSFLVELKCGNTMVKIYRVVNASLATGNADTLTLSRLRA